MQIMLCHWSIRAVLSIVTYALLTMLAWQNTIDYNRKLNGASNYRLFLFKLGHHNAILLLLSINRHTIIDSDQSNSSANKILSA